MPDGLRLLVFDWDGTLLDSVSAIVGCTRATLAELAMEPMSDDEIKAMIGLGLRETVETMCPGCDEVTYRRVLDTYGRLWVESWRLQPRPFAGVEEMLADLRAAGWRLAVATAKTRRGLERDFERAGFAHLFHTSRTVDEARSKPHPLMLEEILAEVGVGADEALMIGDTIHDVQMALAAGVGAVAVTSGAARRHELEELEPLACLESVAELPGWLAARGAAC